VSVAVVGGDQGLGEPDHGRVVGGDHRVRVLLEQGVEHAGIGVVDAGLVGVGDLWGLLVGALDQADRDAEAVEALQVVAAAVEVGLDADADVVIVALELLDDVEGAADVDGGLHVDADHGADLLAPGGHPGGLLEGQLLSDVEAEGGQLDRDVGVHGPVLDAVQGGQVRAGRLAGLGLGLGVLPQVVEGHRHPPGVEGPDRMLGLLQGVAGDEPVRDPAGDRVRGHLPLQERRTCRLQQRRLEHGSKNHTPPGDCGQRRLWAAASIGSGAYGAAGAVDRPARPPPRRATLPNRGPGYRPAWVRPALGRWGRWGRWGRRGRCGHGGGRRTGPRPPRRPPGPGRLWRTGRP
jgi:hypothetical protein